MYINICIYIYIYTYIHIYMYMYEYGFLGHVWVPSLSSMVGLRLIWTAWHPRNRSRMSKISSEISLQWFWLHVSQMCAFRIMFYTLPSFRDHGKYVESHLETASPKRSVWTLLWFCLVNKTIFAKCTGLCGMYAFVVRIAYFWILGDHIDDLFVVFWTYAMHSQPHRCQSHLSFSVYMVWWHLLYC